MKSSQGLLIRLIAIFKLVKASLLIVVGIGALKLVHNDTADALDHWIHELRINPDGRYVDEAVGKLMSISPRSLRDVGFGSFVYAGLFLTEGLGLWLMKRWAEWFTVIITSSLVPLEVYELYRHPTIVKGLVLVINTAVVLYLLLRIRRERSGTS